MLRLARLVAPITLALAACGGPPSPKTPAPPVAGPAAAPVDPAVIADAKARLLERHGDAHRARIDRGVDQVAALWQPGDGDLVAFVVDQFVADPAALDTLFARLEAAFEQLDGHALEVSRMVRWHADVDTGPLQPIDKLLATYDPEAHLVEDLFASKVAFAALLNFPLTTLEDRLRDGDRYTRRQWAEVRLTERFDRRIPGEVGRAVTAAEAAADQYISAYNVWMHHVLDDQGRRLFPKGKRLISHWNLRDELKANYADPDGLAKQRTIVKVMERIVTQTIPAVVIDDPRVDWNPFTNEVTAAPAGTVEADAPTGPLAVSSAREPDRRFQHVIDHATAARRVDPYAPTAPSHLARAFAGAEMPEARVRELIVAILESPHVATAAKEIERRLGRPLGPQDLWFEFGAGGTPEAELDAITRTRYPTADAFAADLPRILGDLGFPADDVALLVPHIAVDPSRGAGHAFEARRRGDQTHLRTRVEAGGMDYKGYNIAVHELGHNVEQVYSLYQVDHTLLAGVPNTAFTEALAFLFQARDLALLGRPAPGAEAERLRVLDAFWNTWEIAGSALVEIDVWHWIYDHPDATATELRDATVRIATETWNRYYAPVLNERDVPLLGIYSHTITSPLYLFNYVLGHLIAFQVEEHLAGADAARFAAEFERIASYGRVTPDVWMTHATGAPVSAQPMLDAAGRALAR